MLPHIQSLWSGSLLSLKKGRSDIFDKKRISSKPLCWPTFPGLSLAFFWWWRVIRDHSEKGGETWWCFFKTFFPLPSIVMIKHKRCRRKRKKNVISKSMSDLSLSPAHRYHNGKVAHFTKLASKYIIASSYLYLLIQGHGKKSPAPISRKIKKKREFHLTWHENSSRLPATTTSHKVSKLPCGSPLSVTLTAINHQVITIVIVG